MATNPIRWDNIEPSNYAGIAAAMAAGRRGVSDGIQGIADQFTQMKDDRISLATQEAKAQLLGLTDRGSYAQDSAGIIGGLDRGNVNLDDVLKFQQNREKHLLDTSIDRFKADHMQQRFDMDMQGKQSRINRNNRAGTKATDNRVSANEALAAITELGPERAREFWIQNGKDPRIFGTALKSLGGMYGKKPPAPNYKTSSLPEKYGSVMEDQSENFLGFGGYSAEEINALDARYPRVPAHIKQEIFDASHREENYDMASIETQLKRAQLEVDKANAAKQTALTKWNSRPR